MSGALRINFPSMPVVRRKLDETRRLVLDEVRKELGAIADAALLRVKQLTPVDTSKTRNLWRLFILNRGGPRGKAQGAFFAAIDHPYNKTGASRTDRDEFGKSRRVVVNDGRRSLLTDLEFGTRPHFIRPKKPGGLLRFKIGSKTIYTKEVAHPGTRAYNMTTIAAAEAQQRANAALSAILLRARRKLEEIR